MSKIRVLHILDELNTGGAERVVVRYFQQIDRNKFHWDFVITQNPDPTKKGMLEDVVESLGGNIFKVPRKRKNYFRNVMAVSKIIHDGNYDIVHSHLDELSVFYLASAKHAKVPVRICHSHLAGAKRGLEVELICNLIKPLLKLVTTDKFSCGIDAAISLWGEKDVHDGKVYIMKNAIETNSFRYTEDRRNNSRANLQSNGRLVVGSVGRLSYQKNPNFIIDVFAEIVKQIPASLLVMVGEGEMKEQLEALTTEYGISDKVLMLGARDDVNELMQGMDVFLLPSRFEGLPIVLVEAQCSGLPCVVSNTVTQEIKINDNVIFLPVNENAFLWARHAVQMAQKCEGRASKVKAIVDHGYDIRSAARELEEHYTIILNGVKTSHEIYI